MTYRYTWSIANNRYEDSRPESTNWIEEDEVWTDSVGNHDITTGRFTLRREDGGVEFYSGTGRILSLRDVRGVGYAFTYGLAGNGPLQTVTHTSGRQISLTFDTGRFTSVTDPDGKVYTYGYNGMRLVSVTYPDGLGTKTYHYENAAQPDGLTGYSIDGVRKTRYAYRTDGRVDYSGREGGVERDSFAYGSTWTDVTNALGYTTRYNFTTMGGIKRLSSVSMPASLACASGVASTTYGANGYVSKEVDFEGYQTLYTWNNRGQLQEKRTGVGPAPGNSSADQQRTTYGWDVTRNLLTRESHYGSSGSIQSETLYTYHPDSPSTHARLLQKVETCAPDCASGNKRTTTYSYVIRANRMIQTVTVDGPLAGTGDSVTYQYDAAGNLVSATNGLGHAVTWSNHDGLGRTGRLVRENGAVEEYTYDARGRVTQATAIVGGTSQTTSHTYDGAGQLLSTTTPDGVTLTRQYDPVGRLLREYHNEAGGTFAVKRYTYNDLSQVTSVKVQRTTAVVKPSGTPTLTLGAGAAGSYTLNWTTSNGVEYYQLQEKVDGGAWATTNQGLSTSRAFSGQAAGTYAYRVRACNAEGCTGYSTEQGLEVVYPPASAPTLTAPAASSTGAFSVTWNSVATATRYELQQRKDGGSWSKIHDAAARSKAVSSLANGSYGYRVRACNPGGCTAYSATRTTVVTHPPTTAPALTAPATNSTGGFTVTWTSVTSAARYELQQRKDGGSWSKIHDAAARSKAVSSLANGSYGYRVRACNAGGCAAYSAIQTTAVTHPPSGAPTVTAPATNNNGSFTVTWTSVATATRYELQQRKDDGGWSKIHDASSPSKAVSGLSSGSYDYRARACNAGGCATYSAIRTTVVTHPPTTAPALTAPAASSTGAFSVTWASVATATRYELQQRKDGGSWSKIQDAAGTSKAVTGLTSGSYGYRVRACNAGGCAAYSAIRTTVVTHPPTAAPALTAPATNSTGGFTVTWTSVTAATRYELQQRKDGGSWSKIHDAAARSKAVSSLANGSYGYRVRACNAGGCAAYSAIQTTVVTHPPSGAPTVTAPATNNNGSFTVTWSSVATTTRYELQQRKDSGSWNRIHDAAGRSKAVSGLANGSYGYRVRACNAGGCGAYSTVRTTVVTHPPASAPSLNAPGGNAANGFSFKWSAVATANRYEMYQSPNNGPWLLAHNGPETQRTVHAVDGQIRFRVRACNAGGCGPYSNIRTITVFNFPDPCPPGSGPCNDPLSDPGSDQ